MLIHTKRSKAIYRILRLLLGRYVTARFNLVVEGEEITELKPPYLVLANHTNFWDPFFVACFLPEPVYFVTADEYFRHPLLKMALQYVRAIPKSKFIADFETVRTILKVKKAGGVIGVFPEGKRNWDGGTEPIIYSTAKLIKALKVPVVTALLQGAHLSKPRWARKPRRGKIIVSYRMLFTPEEVSELTIDELHKRVVSALAYDEYGFQEQVMIPYKGGHLAEKLELYLFICPHCRKVGTMQSAEDEFFCNHCGYGVVYDEYGYFHPKAGQSSGSSFFRQPQEWNRWQLAFLKEEIAAGGEIFTVLMEDRYTLLLRGARLKPLKKVNSGYLQLRPDDLLFVSSRGERIEFSLHKISGLNVQQNNKLEFYYGNDLYRFRFRPGVSAYKWTKGIELAREQKTKFRGGACNE